MAALSRPACITVRAALPGEGGDVAALWRELWDAHEAWGGYPGTRDARVYARLAQRIDDDARVRGGHPVMGRHVHLVADRGGRPCGQVEGWFERHGVDPATPFTCEVRSLIVARHARGLGAGRALLAELAAWGRQLAAGAPCVLAAEVLEPNPAHAFYAAAGYAPASYSARLETRGGARLAGGALGARVAQPRDALAVACLEGALAARRRASGDARFDGPRAVDATRVGAIAAHLGADASGQPRDPATLVAVDAQGAVRGAATFTVHTLEPPFVPMRRALLGRFAIDPACAAGPVVTPLLALASRMALAQTAPAPHMELTDLSAPGTELYDAALAAGAAPWSRVVLRRA